MHGFQKALPFDRSIRQDDSEMNGRIPRRVVAEIIANMNDMTCASQLALDFPHGGVEVATVVEGSFDSHEFIILSKKPATPARQEPSPHRS